MLKVRFFASFRQALDCSEIEVALQPSVAELRRVLCERGETWTKVLSGGAVQVAVNQSMADDRQSLADGDEVAFFPPVTGG